MLRWILAACVFLGTGFKAANGPLETYSKRAVEEIAINLPVEVDVPVRWVSCGTWNGAYYYSGRIELCNENIAEGPGVARFIFLHELGHAYTFGRGTGFERFYGNYEAAADDFAAVISIVQGHPEDLVAMANAYEDWGKWNVQDPNDPHPSPMARAQHLRDIYLGYMAPWTPEFKAYQTSLVYWRYQFMEHP